MHPVAALERIAYLLEQTNAPRYRVGAFRNAAAVLGALDPDDLVRRSATGRLRSLPGIGGTTETVVRQALAGEIPDYLARLEEEVGTAASDDSVDPVQQARADDLRTRLRGDCHTHSDWSDGGSTIDTMARAGQALKHEYMVLTDHSPRLTVARGLTADRLRQQLEVVAALNELLASEASTNGKVAMRLLTGIEVDILDDGSLDQDSDLLASLDVVVASVHSKLAMEPAAMTRRMVVAAQNPHVDILGHCTGRLVAGKGRPESRFDAAAVFGACARSGTAVEINCRPERLDPPRRLLSQAIDAGCLVAIDTDAHAPGQLEWQGNGTRRAIQCDVPVGSIVNTWPVDELLAWTAHSSERAV